MIDYDKNTIKSISCLKCLRGGEISIYFVDSFYLSSNHIFFRDDEEYFTFKKKFIKDNKLVLVYYSSNLEEYE